MTRLLLIGALSMAVFLGIAVAAMGRSTKEARPGAEFTIHVIEHATTDAVTNPGVGGKADNVGDILTFANEVFDRTNSRHSGHDQGMCVRTVAGAAWECWWTTFLAGGQLSVEGPFYDARNSRLAVTGGTGAYRNARGWMQLKSRAGGTEFDFVFHITRNR
jgi:allene oxide cyclase